MITKKIITRRYILKMLIFELYQEENYGTHGNFVLEACVINVHELFIFIIEMP